MMRLLKSFGLVQSSIIKSQPQKNLSLSGGSGVDNLAVWAKYSG